MNALVAIPSNNPGGLGGSVAQHFGHCDLYTVADIKNGEIDNVFTIPAVPHQQGGCMAPVQYLASKNIQYMISGGMGFRPLVGFEQVGIDVYHYSDNTNIKQAVEAFINGELPKFNKDQTCGGGAS